MTIEIVMSVNQMLKACKKADDAYYNTSKETKKYILKDSHYDALKCKLEEVVKQKTLDKELHAKVKKYLKSTGAKVRSSKRDTKLPFMIGSLNKVTKDKITKLNSLKKVCPKADFLLGGKADGTSITLRYDKNILSDALSRGDGVVGQSKLEHIKNIKGIARKLDKDLPDLCYVRGEVVIHKKLFEKQFKDKEYKEARNAGSGWINSDNPDNPIHNIAYFIPHELLGSDGLPVTTKKIRCKLDAVKYMNSIFKTPYVVKHITSYEKLIEVLEESLTENATELFYETDGSVFELNDYDIRNSINKNNNTKYPKYAIAYKQSAKDAAVSHGVPTKVTEISVSVNKSSVLFPTINFKPVVLGNSNVSKASGKSFKHICENGFEKGSRIVVVKAGGVIPEVYLTDKPKKIKPIKHCACGAKTARIDGKNGAWTLYCSKPHKCEFVKRANLEATLKRLKLTGLGAKNIEKLFEHGFTDIFELLQAKDKKILSIDGFGDSVLTTIKRGIPEKLSKLSKAALMDCSGVFVRTGLSLAEGTLKKLVEGKIKDGERYQLYKERLKEFKSWKNQLETFM